MFHRGGDPADLAAKLRELIGDPRLYADLSRNGPAAFARQRCDLMLVDALHAWADAVLGEPRG